MNQKELKKLEKMLLEKREDLLNVVKSKKERDLHEAEIGDEIDKAVEEALEGARHIIAEDLLYICDRIQDGRHVVHLTFLIEQVGGTLRIGHEPENDANPIKNVKMVPLNTLTNFGFSTIFQDLALSGFKDRGTYKGSIKNIGLEN